MKKRNRGKLGFTMTEMLVTVGIIAILAAIAIPSVIAIRNALEFRRLNDTAKAVFMAAQSNLVEMRASGEIKELKENASAVVPASGAYHVSSDSSKNADFEGWLAEYFYTTSRMPGASEADSAFSRILPANSIEGVVREGNILIEYNPYAASVYSVFYTEREDLVLADAEGSYAVSRDSGWRKSNKVGYYNGSIQESLSGSIYTDEEIFASVDLENGQEAVVVASVPIPAAYANSPTTFMEHLNASAVVTGTQSGGSFTLPESAFAENKMISADGRSIEFRAVLDSLKRRGSFAGLAANNKSGSESRGIAEIADEGSMFVLPGENVTIEAAFTYDTSDGDFFAPPASVVSDVVNPLFASMTETADGKYIIHIANGRHLQNLNQVAASVGSRAYQVTLDSDVYWNETVGYYQREYQENDWKSDAAEVPGRCLPLFVPISNESMFGSAVFHADTSGFLNMGKTPAMDDYKDVAVHAVVEGGNHKISYLNIDARDSRMTYNGASGAKENSVGKPYYAGMQRTTISGKKVGQPDMLVGLFSYANTTIQNLFVVNPTVKGSNLKRADTTEKGLSFPAAGCLIGAAGWNSFVYNCGAYIDPTAPYYDRTNVSNYGVEGYGAVGGLVGYSKSHRTLSDGILDFRADHLSFANSFASVYVKGTMFDAKGYNSYLVGYVNGVGGLVGVSVLSNYYNCYSGSTVTGYNMYFQTDVSNNSERARGVGGFVGTCRGTKYTNCFATGDVEAHKLLSAEYAIEQGNNLGAGGFVGIIYNNENYEYKDGALTELIKQLFGRKITQYSQFNDCYSLGTIRLEAADKSRSVSLSGFAGLYLKGSSANYDVPNDGDNRQNGAALKKGGGYGERYVYSNLVYLNNAAKTDNWLPKYYLLGIPVIVPGEEYYKAIGESKAYTELTDEFQGWKTLSASQTHGYNISGAYPFAVPAVFDSFYGTWPVRRLNAYIGYYERYANGKLGVYAFGEEFSTLRNDSTVVEDGYCVLAANSLKSIEVQADGQNWRTISGKAQDIMLRNETYNVYILSKDIQADVLKTKAPSGASAAQKFYSHIVVREGAGKTEYHLYYNPRFARVQLFGSDHERAITNWNEIALPESIAIRTARQFYELGKAPQFWGESFHYAQELNIDADTYRWNDVTFTDKSGNTAPVFSPIGSADVPFLGSYDGSVNQCRIDNVTIQARADNNYGLFGVVGDKNAVKAAAAQAENAQAEDGQEERAAAPVKGRVENITVPGKTVSANVTLNNAALVCAENYGILWNVTVDGNTRFENGNITNVGVIAGLNAGTISDARVNASAVTLQGKNAGSVAGTNSGSVSADVTIGSFLGKSDGAVGGVIGSQTDGSFSGKVSIDTVEGQVPESGVVGGIFGSFSGTLQQGSTSFKTVKSGNGTAAGIAGTVVNGTVSNYTVTVGTVSGGKGASGGFGSGDKLIAENVQIQAGNITASGDAAGFALSLRAASSNLEQCSVELNGKIQSTQGNAAGFVLDSRAAIVNSNVYLGTPGTAGAEIAAPMGTASGFVGTLSGRAETSGVSGVGTVSGGVDAAGFAVEISGEASGCYATTASLRTANKRTAYLMAKASDLKITAPNGLAAGFVVTNNGSLIGNYALGTVSGQTAAGFVAENKNNIRRAQANVTLANGGSGFADTNSGTIDAAYVWYDGDVTNGFLAVNSGKVNGCYAAPLHADADTLFAPQAGGFQDCYGLTGEETAPESDLENVNYSTIEDFDDLDVSVLDAHTLGTNWQHSGAKQYPYSSELSLKPYVLPSLFSMNQYGDWVDTYDGTVPSYGVLYYEVDDADNYYLGSVQVVDGSNLWPENVADRIVRDFPRLSDLKTECASYGYAVIALDTEALKEIVSDVDFDNPISKLANEFFVDYGVRCYPVTVNPEAASANVMAVSGITFNPYFADAIWATGTQAPDPYRIRAAQQLENVGVFHNKNFVLEQDVNYSGKKPITQLSGTLDGGKHSISGAEQGLLNTLNGSLTNLNIAGSLTKPLVKTMPSGLMGSVTVNGSLFNGLVGAMGGTMENIVVNGDVSETALLGNVSGSVDGLKVTGNLSAAFAGNVTGTMKKLTVDKNVSGSAPMFGEVSGLVENLLISGRLDTRMMNTLSGSLRNATVGSFSGTSSMFGTVSGQIGQLPCDDFPEGVAGLTVGGAAEQSIADTVSQDALVANVEIGSYANTKGMFGTVAGELNNVTVSSAALNVTVKGNTNAGILVDTLAKTGAVNRIAMESSTIAVNNNLNGATGTANVGAVAGLVSGGMIADADVAGLEITVGGAKGGGTFDLSLGGAAGRAEKNETVPVIRNCAVTFRNESENVKVDLEFDNFAAGKVKFGGLVGDCQAVVAGSSVEYLNMIKPGHSSGNGSNRPAVETCIGGLVGMMEPEGALYGSYAGREKTIAIEVQGSNIGKKTATHYVGGAVGSDASDAAMANRARFGQMSAETLAEYRQLDSSYSNEAVYAVADVKYTSTNSKVTVYMGQFIGRVTNGSFLACEGWGNAADFYGTIPQSTQTLKGVYVSENQNAPESGYGDPSAAYRRQDVTLTVCDADFANCTYQKGDQVICKENSAQNYLYEQVNQTVAATKYSVNRMIGHFKSEGTKNCSDWGSGINGKYVYRDGAYYPITGLKRKSVVNWDYIVTYGNGQTFTIKGSIISPAKLELFSFAIPSATDNGSYMTIAFNGGVGYALAKDGTAVTTFQMPGNVSAAAATFSFVESGSDSGLVWANKFSQLQISGGLQVSQGQSNSVALASGSYDYFNVSKNGQYLTFQPGTNSFAVSASPSNLTLYEVTTSNQNLSWHKYQRAVVPTDKILRDKVLDVGEFPYGSSAGLVAAPILECPEITNQTEPDFYRSAFTVESVLSQSEPEEPEEFLTDEPEEPEETEPIETEPTEPTETEPTEPTETEPTEPSEASPASEASEPPKQEPLEEPAEEERS